MFQEGAELVLEFAFDTLGVHRLEARAAVQNGRGNGALQKLGAVQEGVLRKSFVQNGEYLDQVLYAILERRLARRARRARPELSRARALSDVTMSRQGPATITWPAVLLLGVTGDVSTGRDGSLDHSLHEPGYSLAPCRPACSSASRFWQAVTPDPQ